ncbi:MAG: DUF7948 domain-containing protein [Armatimonadota bacterium]
MKRSAWLFIVFFALIAATFSSASVTSSGANAKGEVNARYAEAYGKLPLSFVENKGQLNKAVRYVINGPRASAFFTNTGVTFDLAEALPKKPRSPRSLDPVSLTAVKPVKHVALKMEFAGASSKCRVAGVDKLPGKVNIMKGSDSSKWKTDISTYKGIIYKDAWKGIDVSYSGNKKQVKYDIIVNPGAKVSDIKLKYSGADKIWLDAKGDLHIKTAMTSFTETVPGIHQTKSGRQAALKGGYVLLDNQTVGFKVQGANPRLPIVIDPASDLVYSTFLGGVENDKGSNIAVDSSGCAYVTGHTFNGGFPTTLGAFDGSLYNYGEDFYITKLNSTGSGLVYSTVIGGLNDDCGVDITVDLYGRAYVTGTTESEDFPTTQTAFDRSYCGGETDVFVVCLNSSGSFLEYSTFLGGDYIDTGLGIAIDSSGCAYIAGRTLSLNFPSTPGAFNSSRNRLYIQFDGFITKLNASGSELVYSTIIGGDLTADGAFDIAVDSSGCAYVIGQIDMYDYSKIDLFDFPITPNAFDTSYNGQFDLFVTKLNSAGSGLEYSTLLGGNKMDYATGITIDSSGCAYVIGYTDSIDFPTTSEAYDRSHNGSSDAFITKLNSQGSRLEYSTFLGGMNYDYGYCIAADSSGYVYVTGNTGSSDFPVTTDAFDISYNNGEAFITKIDPIGSRLEYSTFFGGIYNDEGYGIALDSVGCGYVTGYTKSHDFPMTPDTFDASYNGGEADAFIAKLDLTMISDPGPDLLLKAGNEISYSYNNIYSDDGNTQIKTQNASVSQPARYEFMVQNDGKTNDSFKITSIGGGVGWGIRYYDLISNIDITAQVTGNGWISRTLVPGETSGVYALITPDSTVAFGRMRTYIITAVSQGDNTKKDVGKVITTAIPACKSDILMKAGNESSYNFNNIYSTDGSNQTKTQNASIGQTVNYGFRIQNDGNTNDIFKITGPAERNGWKIRYYDLTTNADVTSQVTGSGWSSGTLVPGATNGVYVKVTPDNTVSPGSVNTLLITAVSQGDTSKKDLCKAVTTAVSTCKTDILMKAGAETAYSFNNIYSTDGSNQTKTLNASTNQKVNYGFRVQNDGNIADSFKITGLGGGDGWTVKYCDLTTNADVTAQVTGSGWTSGSLAPGTTNGVYVFVTPDSTVPAGSEKILVITAVSQSDALTKDVCKAVTRKQ